MNNKVFTIQELQSIKFCELSNAIYNAIARELEKFFGTLFNKVLPILDKSSVIELDQYVNIYKYILVI